MSEENQEIHVSELVVEEPVVEESIIEKEIDEVLFVPAPLPHIPRPPPHHRGGRGGRGHGRMGGRVIRGGRR